MDARRVPRELGQGMRQGSGEFISYSEWETEADIERYINSEAHKQIVRHTQGVKGANAVVKLYDLVN
jgi:heme-degrading monooxygenase HmoA